VWGGHSCPPAERTSAGFEPSAQPKLAAFLLSAGFTPDEGVGAPELSLRPFPPPNNPTLMHKVNIAEKFSHITEYWKPYIGAELNGQAVKFDKLKGEFIFHHHDNEDEMFLVVKGRFRMEFRDRHEWIEEGEFIVIPRGVEHKPVADEECWLLLFEPASTLNTGNVVNERTQPVLERV
jgi:mannose-6-phosphate isomerase-like protein (cupin superfamily)